jgi:general secretion pathway protein B
MSLILDALKRAEQERKLGQPPEAAQVASMTPPLPATAPRDRTLVIVLAVLLMAAAIVIGALLLRGHRPPPVAATAPVPAAVTPAPAVAQPAPATAPPPAPPPTAAVLDRGRVSNLDDVVAADDGTEENEQAARVAQGDLPGDAPPAPRPRTRAPQHRAAAVPPPSPPPLIDSDANVVTTPDPAAGVPALRQMPEAYRSGFPQLAIQVHAYNDDPDRRFIIVDGTAYHEGAKLPQGPTIAAIAPDGIVFDWQGQRVFYSLSGN